MNKNTILDYRLKILDLYMFNLPIPIINLSSNYYFVPPEKKNQK